MSILTFVKEMLKYELRGHNQREAKMASVFDVARYILDKQGSMTTMKLQKLVYYCQAWSAVWDPKPIFDERIEAWASGPVVPDLYQHHKGQYQISTLGKGDVSNLGRDEIDTIDAVLDVYGDRSAQWLSDLTHMEKPYKEAREGFDPGEHCENEITLSSLEEYYGSL
jgi:uncharacterized phage-associated protein